MENGEGRRTNLTFFAVKTFHKKFKSSLEIAHGYSLVNNKSFDLMKKR